MDLKVGPEVDQFEDSGMKDVENVRHAPKTDNQIPWTQSLKQNPIAVGWCLYMLFTCVMWGYDGLAGAIVLALPAWRKDYGYLYQGQYVVSANWQLGFTAASLIGLILGGGLTGLLSKRFGQKIVMASGYVLTVAGVFLQWFSPGNLPMFFGGKLLTGIPLGIFLTVAPNYCSEVAPPALRGPMVAAINFSIVIGQLLGYGVMREVQTRGDSMSYQIMYAVQWGFAAVALAIMPFWPESPMRLVARGKTEKARRNVTKLYPNVDADTRIQEIQSVLDSEADASAHQGTFRECFNTKNRIRTLIACSVFFIQANSGVGWVVGYMGYFLQLSGMKGQSVFDTTVGIAGLMAVGNIASWYFVEKLGRQRTILYGLIVCTISLFLIGILSIFVNKGQTIVLTQVAFMAIWAFFYQGSIGAAGYTLVAEVPTSTLRELTQSLATMTNGFSNCIWSFTLPYVVNPDEANLGGKVAFIYFGILVLADVFVYFYYPETKGRSFEEIDELFNRDISPRHFAKTRLD